MGFFDILIVFSWTFIIGYGGYELYHFIMRRRSAKYLTAEEFRHDMRKAQVIDVRERSAFDRKHILGARNVPYAQFKQRMTEIRKDQPIYLYDDTVLLSGRAAAKLKRVGYTDIYILKGGLPAWDGKIKSNK